MKLHGKVPVEQLDDERLTNIERRLVVAVSDLRAPAPRTSRKLVAFAGLAMATALAAVVGYQLRARQEAPVAPQAPIAMTSPTPPPQHFAMHDGTLDLGDTQLTSSQGTDANVERTATRTVVQMQRGSLALAVKHDPTRILIVRAGDTEIEDVGTKFRVDYDGASHVIVRVTEGEVRVTRAGVAANIHAGFGWTTERGLLALAELDAPTVVASAPLPGIVPATGPLPSPSPLPPTEPTAKRPPKSNARLALEKLAIDEPLDVGARDVNTAISKYLDLAVSMGDGQDKTPVLYSIAVVQHRAHQDKAALYTLSAVIKRQGGKAYRAALWLNVRIECMQHFDDECRQAADLYLRKVPDGPAAGVAQAILNELE